MLVRKKDGTLRICVDYRKLNQITKKDAHPLPRTDAQSETLSGSKYFTKLGFSCGYHQVEVAQAHQEKTAFPAPFALFEYKVMPFGVLNAPATFQRLMSLVFCGFLGSTCLPYLDDIIIFSKTFVDHLAKLEVFKRIQQAH